MLFLGRRWMAPLVGILLSAAYATEAAGQEIKDTAGLFSSAAIQSAQKEIASIREQYARNLLIETYSTIPTGRGTLPEHTDAEARARFFAGWAAERMRQFDCQDIFVLICKDPLHVEVSVGQEMAARSFPAASRDGLRDALAIALQKKDYDLALREGVQFVHQKLESNPLAALPGPVAGEVKDYARLFTTKGLQDANLLIQDIQRDLSANVVCETFAKAPPLNLKVTLKMGGDPRSQLFQAWMHDRIRAVGADGVYILICRRPRFVQLGYGSQTGQKTFKLGNRQDLRDLFVSQFQQKMYDRGLLEGLGFVYDVIDKARQEPPPPPTTGEIKDRAAVFAAPAVEQANEELRQIERRTGRKVLFETFETPPAGKRKEVQLMSDADRAGFYTNWLREQLSDAAGASVGILICKQPPHVEVGIGRTAGEAAMTPAEIRNLRSQLADSIRSGQCDNGLRATIRDLSTLLKPAPTDGAAAGSDTPVLAALPKALDKTVPAPTRHELSASWTWPLGVGLVAVGFWVIFAANRRRA
jgi:uncharacterized membrane protein YgcG